MAGILYCPKNFRTEQIRIVDIFSTYGVAVGSGNDLPRPVLNRRGFLSLSQRDMVYPALVRRDRVVAGNGALAGGNNDLPSAAKQNVRDKLTDPARIVK